MFLALSTPLAEQQINIGITISGVSIVVLVTLFFLRQQTKNAVIPFPSVGNPQSLDILETLVQGNKQVRVFHNSVGRPECGIIPRTFRSNDFLMTLPRRFPAYFKSSFGPPPAKLQSFCECPLTGAHSTPNHHGSSLYQIQLLLSLHGLQMKSNHFQRAKFR